MSETRQIPLSRGLFATVDAADYDWLNQWKWSALKTKGGFYACRTVTENGKQRMILMHRFIMDAPKGKIVDHRNRDTLDYRRDNLRIGTQGQNCLNRCANKTGKKTSRFKGVYRDRQYWRARFGDKILGAFHDEEQAARAYDAAALARDTEYALVNFKP